MIKRSSNVIGIDIWEKFLEGDDKSLTHIYDSYVNELYSYGLKISGNEAIVKDCIQDVFIGMIENKKKLLVGSNIHLYLFKSLRNKLLDEIRSSSRKQEILNSKINIEEEFSFSAEKRIIDDEAQLIVNQKLGKVLSGLSNKQREIIYLKYTECLSYDEISVVLSIDKASARTLLYRTLKLLKVSINKKGFILFYLLRTRTR